jgi:hypothetical protein
MLKGVGEVCGRLVGERELRMRGRRLRPIGGQVGWMLQERSASVESLIEGEAAASTGAFGSYARVAWLRRSGPPAKASANPPEAR